MEIKDLNEKELELVKKEMLEDYDINGITLEEYCECHVRRCDNCHEIFFVDYNDNETIFCEECYKEYLKDEEEYDLSFEMDQYDIYIDKKLMEGI